MIGPEFQKDDPEEAAQHAEMMRPIDLRVVGWLRKAGHWLRRLGR